MRLRYSAMNWLQRLSQMFLKRGFCFFLLLATPIAAAECDRVWRGVYVFGPEVETFQPCGSASVYWTSYGPAGALIRDFHQKFTKARYQAIFLEFRGHILNEELDGFAENYDGLIRVSEVLDLKAEIPEDCFFENE